MREVFLFRMFVRSHCVFIGKTNFEMAPAWSGFRRKKTG